MKFCTNCGSKLEDDALVCNSCGHIVATAEQPLDRPEEMAQTPGSAEHHAAGSNTSYDDSSYDVMGSSNSTTANADYTYGQAGYGSGENTQANQDTYGGSAQFAGGAQSAASSNYNAGNSYNTNQYGAASNANVNQNYNQQQYSQQYTQPVQNNGFAAGVQPRNIVLAIVLSLVTCGIYNLYWILKIEEETAQLSNDENKGAMVILLSFITCGIYSWFWYYKLGSERMPRINGKDNGMLYIILAIFGLSIVNLCLVQNDINTAVGGQSF